MPELTFSLADFLTAAGTTIASASLAFGIFKWRDATVNSRLHKLSQDIDKLEIEIKEDLHDIKTNYAQRVEMDKSLKNVELILQDMKTEQYRMSQRMDEFMKWMMQLQTSNSKDG